MVAFRRRVAAGLLTGTPHRRSNYRATEIGADRLLVHAVDWPTALAVGLNEVELRLPQPGVVWYRVRYWRWAAYALGLSGVLGLVGLVLLLTMDVRGYIAGHSTTMVPGLSVDQHLIVAWGMVVFWGFAWPWLLIALHKRPLHRLIARIVAEVDGGDGTSR
jgi:hypothetical protein